MIREKFFHLGEDSTIMNEVGQPIMQVDGKVLSLHDRLIVSDLAGNEVVNVHRRLMTLLCWLHKISAEKIESFPLQFPGFLTTDMHLK